MTSSTPSPPAHPLAQHLYHSLLAGTCADVNLIIHQWNVSYRLHRVVLVQAGFFHSLFCGGFSEADRLEEEHERDEQEEEDVLTIDPDGQTAVAWPSGTRRGSNGIKSSSGSLRVKRRRTKGGGGEVGVTRVELVFDDPNISRTAFEICISRLYSVHPTLALHAVLLPTPKYPLTPSFPNPPVLRFPHDPPASSSTGGAAAPPHPSQTDASPLTHSTHHQHLLTPQTLLSLLSTAIYLGLNSLIKECVGLILGSVGPWSVGAYLGFALGQGAGLDLERDEGETTQGIRGLEGLARKLPLERERTGMSRSLKRESGFTPPHLSMSSDSSDTRDVKQEPAEEETDHPQKCSVKPGPDSSTQRDRSAHPLSPGSVGSYDRAEGFTTPKFFYGPVGDKIGEACMAWLARWAVDLMEVEEGVLELEERRRNSHSTGTATGEENKARTRVTFDRIPDPRTGSPGGLEGSSTSTSTGKGKGLSSSLPEDSQRRRPRSISWQPDFPTSRSSQAIHPAGSRPGVAQTAYPKISHNKFISLSGAVEGFPGSESTLPRGKTVVLPSLKIWGHRGLPAEIIRGIISCDALFIPNEVERYNLAKRVIALRQAGRQKARETRNLKRQGSGEALYMTLNGRKDAQGDLGLERLNLGVKEEDQAVGDDSFEEEEEILQEEEDEEDAELNEIFRTGIYFSHMSFDELSSMSSDINPTTGLPYVPLPVLQAALWAASDVQTRVTSYRPDGTTSTTAGTMGSLNLTHPRAPGVPSRLKPKSTSSSTDAGLVCTTLDITEEIENMTRTMSPRRPNRLGASSPRIMSGRQSPAFGSPNRAGQIAVNALGGAGTGPFCSPMEKHYWPVPVDGTLRIGDAVTGGNVFTPTSPLPDFGPQGIGISPGEKTTALETGLQLREPHSDDKFFGFGTTRKTGGEIYNLYKDTLLHDLKDDALWSRYEPFRFAVEFWGVDQLGEKERLYSTTQFHAGSYFNIYVQTIKGKNKGVQLGIYLHRQSMLEPLPPASRPLKKGERGRVASTLTWSDSSPTISTLPPGHSMVRNPENTLAMYRTMSVTPVGSTAVQRSVSPAGGVGSDDEAMDADELHDVPGPRRSRENSHSKNSPASPYRDPRKTAKVWFAVSCASAMGTALTRFSSGPDMFTVSQSWGWKSSSLRSQEYLAVSEDASGAPSLDERLADGVLGWVSETMDESEFKKRDLKSLRATVCLGVM